MSRVALFLLGPPRIERDGEPVEVDTRKAIALAAYLAVSGESHSRDALAALFWPLSDQTRARAALRRTLTPLRRAVGDDKLEVDGERLALRPGASLSLDVEQFLSLLAKCETHSHTPEKTCPACVAPLSQAIKLYRADFMAGFTLRDSPGFDEWQTFQSESLRLELIWALERLVGCYSDAQEFDAAIAHARRWMAIDPLHDVPHYQLMRLYAWSGQRSAALRQYQEYVQVLEQELGAPPEEEITQLYHELRSNRVPRAPQPSVPAPAHNIPLQPTPFVGREDELLDVGRLLDDVSCRMVTLFGPGGIGKTRLALEVAAQRLDKFAHGVFFVPLAQLASADLLIPAIAESLNFSFHGKVDPKEQLLNYLGEKHLLLVLDNFEHLLAPPISLPEGSIQGKDYDGTGLLSELLSHVPEVKILVTSRERLNLQWEWPFEVAGLRFPQSDKTATPEAYSAIQLFHQSARRAYPAFRLSEAEKPFVIRICQSLLGMPLGIELAAPWVEVSSCEEIAQELERNLDYLTTSRRDVPERHRSLQAVFDHSWGLLSTEERTVLSKLSVFRSGFRREAAQLIAGASLMHLSALMHKSFVRRTATGRYEILEVLRQAAETRLQRSPQVKRETQDGHCEYYAEFLHQRERSLKGPKQRQTLDEIGAEIDNVRAAWRWAVAQRKYRQIDQALESLYRFYESRSWFFQGEADLRDAAQVLGGEDDVAGKTIGLTDDNALLARILTRQGWFCFQLSRFNEGRDLLQACLSAFRRLDLPAETALTLHHLGVATAMLGDLEEPARMFHESVAIYRAINDPIGTAASLNNLGIVAMIKGRYIEAKSLLEESLAIRKERGQLSGIADSLANLGLIAEALGEHDEAKRLHQQCVDISREIGEQWGIANGLCNLGFSLNALGENLAAQSCFKESLEIAADLQAVDLILENLVGIATLLSEDGEREQATELVACTLHHPAIAGKAKERAEQLFAKLESLLTPQTFAEAQDQGKKTDFRHYTRIYGTGQPVV